MRFAILIPAYRPTIDFPQFVGALIASGIERIVVVDDGSGPEFRQLFHQISVHRQVKVVRHAINLGKGAALKTGINAILCEYPDVSVVVTADADGQHHPDDVLAVAREGEAHPFDLVMGVRSFSRDVPLRSRFGNKVTRVAMRVMVGQSLSDSQTGLRSIPFFMLPVLMGIAPQGYDFELDMLVACRERKIAIREVPIRTIYLDGNASSHFNPFLDSMRIYFVLMRFAMVSMSTALIDGLLFSGVYLRTGSILAGQVTARSIAMLINFFIVKQFVFKSSGGFGRQFSEYVLLVIASGTLSFGGIQLLNEYTQMPVLRAKLLVEITLFLANFLVQRDLIFTSRKSESRAELEKQLRAAAAPEASQTYTETR